jgi:hypothetical protein
MLIVFGPGGAALAGPGYFQPIDGESYSYWVRVPGIIVQGVDQRGWDKMRADCLYGQTADDNQP